MSNANDGGSAFPALDGREATCGMTLRDYFAAKVIRSAIEGTPMPEETWPEMLPMVARFSYAVADAMLAERSK